MQSILEAVRTFSDPRECDVFRARAIELLLQDVEAAARELLRGVAGAEAAAAGAGGGAAAGDAAPGQPRSVHAYSMAISRTAATGVAPGTGVPRPSTASRAAHSSPPAAATGGDAGTRRPMSAPLRIPASGTFDAALAPVLPDLTSVAAAMARAIEAAARFDLTVGRRPAVGSRIDWGAAFAEAEIATVRVEVLRQVRVCTAGRRGAVMPRAAGADARELADAHPKHRDNTVRACSLRLPAPRHLIIGARARATTDRWLGSRLAPLERSDAARRADLEAQFRCARAPQRAASCRAGFTGTVSKQAGRSSHVRAKLLRSCAANYQRVEP